MRQIRELLGETAEIPAPYQALLNQVSNTYAKFEADLKLVEAKASLRTEQLIASTSRAYSFLDSIHKGFIMCDTTAEVVLTNNSVRNILSMGSAASNNTERTVAKETSWSVDMIDSLLQPEIHLRELIHQCLETCQPRECGEVNFEKTVLRLYLAPLINEVSQDEKQLLGVVILVEDITEQKVLDRSKDEFLSIASHELRTPLTAIRGNASLIKKYYAASITDKDMAEIIDDIHESSIRLIDIVNDFLDVASIEQGKITMNPEAFLLEEIVNDVVRELKHLCDSKGIALISQPPASPMPAVYADRQRIKQVIYNLAGNAVKFTDEGSITISTKADDKFVYASVKDSGRGMSNDSQRLLFRKFQQAGSNFLTRDTTKGTGLGLYISKLIVELSGGKIGLERSEPSKGSTFAFSLPLSKEIKGRLQP